MTTDVYPRLAFAREIGHTHQSRLDFQVPSLVSLCAPKMPGLRQTGKNPPFLAATCNLESNFVDEEQAFPEADAWRPQGLTGRWPECLHGSLHFVAAQPTRADRAVIAMPLTATPSRPRRERHRLPVCLSVALVQALIGAPSSAPLPAAAPRRRVSCPSLPALFIPRALCSCSQPTPQALLRVQSSEFEL